MVAQAIDPRAYQVLAVLTADAILARESLADPTDPAGWMVDVLGANLWSKQIEIAEAVRDHRRVAVKSCHSSGKSYLAARIVLWYLHAHPHSVVLTTAPTNRQVQHILWRNIRAAHMAALKPLRGRSLTVRYDIAPDWYALGFKAEDTDPDAFQGFHAESALVIIDEAAGVAEPVYEALDAVMTSASARMLLIGNPTNPMGTFHDAFHAARDLYHTITIAASDTPNIREGRIVRPYLITQQWIDDAITKHGEDSPYVEARVHAQFPRAGDNNLIPLAWIEAASYRAVEERSGDLEAGLDVARFGGDMNALCIRQGVSVVHESAWSGLDTMQTVGKVMSILADYPPLAALKVDVIGVGAGVADRLRERGYPVVDVNVSRQARNPKEFANLRHELWWGLREQFREGMIIGPIEDVTMGQLSSVKYSYDSSHSRPVVEAKEAMKKRGLRSPDRAEALMLAFTNPLVRPASTFTPAFVGSESSRYE